MEAGKAKEVKEAKEAKEAKDVTEFFKTLFENLGVITWKCKVHNYNQLNDKIRDRVIQEYHPIKRTFKVDSLFFIDIESLGFISSVDPVDPAMRESCEAMLQSSYSRKLIDCYIANIESISWGKLFNMLTIFLARKNVASIDGEFARLVILDIMRFDFKNNHFLPSVLLLMCFFLRPDIADYEAILRGTFIGNSTCTKLINLYFKKEIQKSQSYFLWCINFMIKIQSMEINQDGKLKIFDNDFEYDGSKKCSVSVPRNFNEFFSYFISKSSSLLTLKKENCFSQVIEEIKALSDNLDIEVLKQELRLLDEIRDSKGCQIDNLFKIKKQAFLIGGNTYLARELIDQYLSEQLDTSYEIHDLNKYLDYMVSISDKQAIYALEKYKKDCKPDLSLFFESDAKKNDNLKNKNNAAECLLRVLRSNSGESKLESKQTLDSNPVFCKGTIQKIIAKSTTLKAHFSRRNVSGSQLCQPSAPMLGGNPIINEQSESEWVVVPGFSRLQDEKRPEQPDIPSQLQPDMQIKQEVDEVPPPYEQFQAVGVRPLGEAHLPQVPALPSVGRQDKKEQLQPVEPRISVPLRQVVPALTSVEQQDVELGPESWASRLPQVTARPVPIPEEPASISRDENDNLKHWF